MGTRAMRQALNICGQSRKSAAEWLQRDIDRQRTLLAEGPPPKQARKLESDIQDLEYAVGLLTAKQVEQENKTQ